MCHHPAKLPPQHSQVNRADKIYFMNTDSRHLHARVKRPAANSLRNLDSQEPSIDRVHNPSIQLSGTHAPPDLGELPPIPAIHALAEGRHGLVGTPRLRLAVAHHLLPALAALELLGDALLDLGDHGLVQVLGLELLVLEAALVALHLVVGHDDEFLGGNVAGEDAFAQGGVGFGLEVLEEGAHFCLVGVVDAAGVAVGGGFDVARDGEDGFGDCA